MFKINKLQGDTVQHREDSQYFGITINEFINFFFFFLGLFRAELMAYGGSQARG